MTLPRWIRALVSRAVPPEDLDEVLGDLEEVHRRRLERVGGVRAGWASGAEAVGIVVRALGARARRGSRQALMTRSELRLALRLSRRTPVVSFAALAALSVAIGLATTGFTVVAAVLDRELPLPDGDRVVDIAFLDGSTREARPLPAPATDLVGEGLPGLDHVGLAGATRRNVRHASGEVELVSANLVTPGSLDRLGIRPLLGRSLTAADAAPGAEPVIVLGEGWWAARFDRDPSVVERTLDVGGGAARVVGVLPEHAVYPGPADLWSPLTVGAASGAAGDPGAPLPRGLRLFGVLSPGATPQGVAAALEARAAGWSRGDLLTGPLAVSVRRTEDVAESTLPGMAVLVLLVGLLILVAGNVANLIVARTAARRGELAIRTALGAGRARLVVQLSLEVLAMAGLAAVIGLAASQRVLSLLAASEADDLPPWIDLGLDSGVVAFVIGVTLLTTLVAGVAPALRATRSQLGSLLRGGSPGRSGRVFGRVEEAMIVSQVALAIGVLGAAVLVHQGWRAGLADIGVELPADRILVARLSSDAPVTGPSLRALEARLAALPEVVGAASGTHTPGVDAPLGTFRLEDESGGPGTVLRIPTARVGPGYFRVLAASPVAGREFLPEDFGPGALPVALVNRAFVEEHLGSANPLGRRIRIPPEDGTDGAAGPVGTAYRIVGVVPDLGLTATDPARAAGAYLPLTSASSFRAVLRSTGTPTGLEEAVRAAAFAVDPEIGVMTTSVLSTSLAALRRVFAVAGWVFTGFGGLVLGLSLLATYALLAFEVTRRTREIGVRVALGARPAGILSALLKRVGAYVALGTALGTGLGYLLMEVARATFVHRLPPTAPWTFLALAALALIVGSAAAWAPARRALRVDPMEALRAD